MSYQVTARKWRPMIFDDVIGQEHVTNTLRNAIASNRVAHAYLFSGTRGCGKTTTARILARSLNCSSPSNQNPDNTCDICKEILENRSMDVIEIDGASNRGVEEIRNLRDSVRYAPTHGKYKIYIIDEVHMLTKEAFNALLKTLEEPPSHVVFIFATTEVHKVPMTILSRCQRFDFRRIAVEEIIGSLAAIAKAEGITVDAESLMIIAKKADGSMRDSQSIFDQVRSFCGNDIKAEELLKAFNVVDQELYFRVSDVLRTHNAPGAVALVDQIMKSGYDLREFVGGLAEHLRNLLIVRSTGSLQLIESSEHFRKRYEAEAKYFSETDLLRYIKFVNDLEQALRWVTQPRYRLETALLQMASMEQSVQIGELLKQVDELKKKIDIQPLAAFSSSPALHAPVQNTTTAELKLVGEASAGYLKSKAAHSYSSLIGTDLGKLAGVQKMSSPEQSSTRPVLQHISAEDILARWPEFISDVAQAKIAVGTSLRESQILDVNNGLLRITCPDDYHLMSLKRNKEFLSEKFFELSGKRLRVEPVLTDPNQSVQPRSLNNSTEEKKTATAPVVTAEHPVLALLKRELGAERIE